MKPTISLFTFILLAAAASAGTPAPVTSEPFGKADGVPVEIYTLRNASGMEAKITNYGGTVVSLMTPDRDGKMADVALGFDNADDYAREGSYFGAIIGRYANRIAGAKFDLDGVQYQLSGGLHGGGRGFDKVIWTAKPLAAKDGPALQLTYVSKDGEEGYPGNLSVTATYTLTDKNELRLDFEATTDKPTIVNLSNHTAFNLNGEGEGDIFDHVVTINADKFTPVDGGRIPTGELRPVEGTPLDFRKPVAIGARFNSDDEQMKLGRGYDHNWITNKKPGELGLMATVVAPKTGRIMEVLSTAPGMQFYSGNNMFGLDRGKAGKSYHVHDALSIEPGAFPDSPHHPDFPSVVLRPGEVYKHTIIYRFSAK